MFCLTQKVDSFAFDLSCELDSEQLVDGVF